MRDDDKGGAADETPPRGYADLPTRQPDPSGVPAWRWWLRLFITGLLVGGAAVYLMDLVPLAGVFIAGMVFGIVIDRFVLWPIAVLLARVDDSVRRR